MATAKTAPKQVEGVSRREFLYYLWGASAAMLAAGTCGAVAWFSQERRHYGLETGIFMLDLESIPRLYAIPTFFRDGKSYLVHIAGGLLAFHRECVFDHLRYRWIHTNMRFECPGCGSKYRIDGTVIEGIANRELDRFMLEVTTPNGMRYTSAEGDPVDIDDATQIVLNTKQKIPGKPRPRN
jgi:hypothetical protein